MPRQNSLPAELSFVVGHGEGARLVDLRGYLSLAHTDADVDWTLHAKSRSVPSPDATGCDAVGAGGPVVARSRL